MMEDIGNTFVLFLLSSLGLFLLSLLLIKRKHKPPKETNLKRLKTFGILDICRIVYTAFEKNRVVGYQKESRYQKLYNKFASSSSSYSKEPYLWKVFGKTIALFAFDFETVNEINTSDAFNDRGPETLLKLYSGGDSGGIMMNNFNNEMKELKKFTVKTFGQLGLGKTDVMTSMLGDQLSELLDRIENIRKETGNRIQVKGMFSSAVFNVIAITVAGKRFSEEDPLFIEACNAITEITDYHVFKLLCILSSGNIWGFREVFGYNYLCNLRDRSIKLIRDFVNERESFGLYKDNPEVFLDFFLRKIYVHKNDDKFKSIYCMEQLLTLLQDLLITGMDSSSKSLESFVMFMALYPDVQCKVQREVDEVVGMTALPIYYEHKSRMNYTLATIYEVHRMSNIVPVIPRMTTKDIEIRGHYLKKGTFVVNLMPALRFDDSFWKDPSLFCPDRFLDCNRQIIQENVDRLLVFGKGPRGCPGENIAPVVAFTFATGFLQKFSVRKQDNSEILGIKEDFGAVSGPLPFHISVFDR